MGTASEVSEPSTGLSSNEAYASSQGGSLTSNCECALKFFHDLYALNNNEILLCRLF